MILYPSDEQNRDYRLTPKKHAPVKLLLQEAADVYNEFPPRREDTFPAERQPIQTGIEKLANSKP